MRDDAGTAYRSSAGSAPCERDDCELDGCHGECEQDDRGIAIVWLAMTLLIMLSFAGLAVDLSNWYLNGDRMQRAADAGAHAGVVFLPGDLSTAATTARRETARNGLNDGIMTGTPNAVVQVSQEPNPNRLRVKVTHTVPTFFVRLLGIDSVTFSKEAVAEYVSPVPMGSPENKLGNDPETGYNSPQFWVNIGAPNATKVSGDRFATKVCDSSVARCTGVDKAPITNDDYDYDGYFFTADVKSVTPGQPLNFEVFDASMVYVGDSCTTNMPSAANLTTLAAWYPDAATRYSNAEIWCTGDQNIGGTPNMNTTFIVRAPDETPWSDTDNPMIGSCTPKVVPAYNPGGGNPTIFQWLNPSDGVADAEAIINPANGSNTFAEYWRRWATVCSVPAGSVTAGKYVIQVRSNATVAAPLVYNSTVATNGFNRMSIRVGFGSAGTTAVDGSAVSIFARGKLPIYANATAADTRFYLSRITPNDAGRTLRISLFDMGDAASPGTLQILPPTEFGSSISGCTFSRNDGASLSGNAGTCTLSNVSTNNGYNGRIVTIDIPIPSNYTCATSSQTGCWFRVLGDFPGGVNDTTTWSATILGNPVRLVE